MHETARVMCVLCTRACSIFISLSTTTKMPAANSFFPLLNSCLAQNFKKKTKTKPTKTKQQSEIYSGLITSWIMTKKKAYHQMCLTWNAAASFYGHDERSFNNNNNKIGRQLIVNRCNSTKSDREWSIFDRCPVRKSRVLWLFNYFYFKRRKRDDPLRYYRRCSVA